MLGEFEEILALYSTETWESDAVVPATNLIAYFEFVGADPQLGVAELVASIT